jgi:hypothetical protein
VSATNLSFIPPAQGEAKLTFEAIVELVDLARELNVSSKKGDRT